MSSVTLHADTFRMITDQIDGLSYSQFRPSHQMSIHQTVNFLIYHLQVALGEVMLSKARPYFWGFIRKQIGLHWRYSGTPDKHSEARFANLEYPASQFQTDKNTLIAKLRKFIMHENGHERYRHPVYGVLEKDEYALLIIRMIDFYLQPFGKQRPSLS